MRVLPFKKHHLLLIIIFFVIFSDLHGYAKELSEYTYREYQLKAGFIFNFIKLTKWPSYNNPENTRPYRIFVVGEKGLEASFADINGKKYNGRIIRIYFVDSLIYFPDGFDLLFITGKRDKLFMHKLLQEVKGLPVLTIGEDDNFIDSGGIINFFSTKDRLRFSINPEAAKKNGLKISSKLLKLALIKKGAAH